MDTTHVARAVERSLAVTARAVTYIHTLGDSIVCDVDLGDRAVIFKADGLRALRMQAWAAEHLPPAGVPAPRVLVVDESCEVFPGSYLIMERAPGEPVGASEVGESLPEALTIETGALLRRLHSLTLPGWGWIWFPEEGARGYRDGWYEEIVGELHWSLAYALKHGLLDGETADRAWDAVRARERALRAFARGCVVHGDLRAEHVYALDGRVSAFIDVQGRVGDPVFDFRKLRVWNGPESLACLLEGYRPDGEVSEGVGERLPLYELLETIVVMRWLHERAPSAADAVERLRRSVPERLRAV